MFEDFLTKSLVTPLIAEETTITLYFFFMKLIIISATFFIRSTDPTEVPPNLRTTIFIDIFFFKILKYVDKIHLAYIVNFYEK